MSGFWTQKAGRSLWRPFFSRSRAILWLRLSQASERTPSFQSPEACRQSSEPIFQSSKGNSESVMDCNEATEPRSEPTEPRSEGSVGWSLAWRTQNAAHRTQIAVHRTHARNSAIARRPDSGQAPCSRSSERKRRETSVLSRGRNSKCPEVERVPWFQIWPTSICKAEPDAWESKNEESLRRRSLQRTDPDR